MEVTLLRYPTEEDWMFCKRCTLVTVGKRAVRPPDSDWRRRMLEARHSPIRELHFAFLLEDVPYCTAMHLVRHHEGVQPYVKTQRNDRQTAYDRRKAPQDAPVDMIWSLNAEGLINVANKRLCLTAETETREVVRRMCNLAIEAMPEIQSELVPMCERNGGVCHEMFPCGRWKKNGNQTD